MTKSSSWKDDRLVEHPFRDSVLAAMIHACRNYSDKRINPEKENIVYGVTFNFFTENDSDKVWVMGGYNSPLIFHDSTGFNQENFVGFFQYGTDYCFFYKNVFDYGNKLGVSENLKKLLSDYIKDWRLRNESENPDFFKAELGYGGCDPYVFEYFLDSVGNAKLLKKGKL